MTTSIPAKFPAITVPLVDSDGTMTPSWYNSLFVPLYRRTGGANGSASTVDLAQQVADVTTQVNAAQNEAALALIAAEAATIQITTIEASVAGATTVANNAASTAGIALSNGLAKANNLSDVQSPSTARQNLGVGNFPLMINFDTVPSGLVRYFPITRPYIMPPGFAGSMTWCGTVPTANAVFTVQYIRSGITTPIGTITFVNGGTTSILSGAGASLVAGDVITVRCPSSADATLAFVGISLSLTLA